MFWLFLIITLALAALTWRWVQVRQTHLVPIGLTATIAFLILSVAQQLGAFGRGFFTALGAVALAGVLVMIVRTSR